MAYQRSFSSNGFASPSASVSSSASAAAASPATVTFSIFQEGPGSPLIFAPPRGTPELQALIDLLIAVEAPASMKMDMIQRDFEAHTARTSERYKTYTVAAPATPTTPAMTTSPSTFTASPSPRFHGVFDSQHQASVTGREGSGSDSSLSLDASPAASDVAFSFSAPVLPMADFTVFPDYSPLNVNSGLLGNVFPMANDLTAAPMWSSTALTATTSTRPLSTSAPKQQRRRLSGSSSMQILTRTGEDVTHMSSRGTRTHEERESTRLVRQRGACPDCRRKKTRCNPDHAGSSMGRVDSARAGPYVPSVQSGRAKAEAEAAKAERARKEKVEGKKAAIAMTPVSLTPQAPNSDVLAGIEDWGGGGGSFGHAPQSDLDLFQDSFDWDLLAADQSQLFTEEDADLSLAAVLSMNLPVGTASGTASETAASVQSGSSSVSPSQLSISPSEIRFRYGHNVVETSSTRDMIPQLGSLVNATENSSNFSTSFVPAPLTEDFNFGDSASFFSAVDASIFQSCVQPGSAETDGLTPSSGQGSLSLLGGPTVKGLNVGDTRGLERHGTISGSDGNDLEECESGQLLTDTDDHGTLSPSLLPLPTSIAGDDSSGMLTGTTSSGASSESDDAPVPVSSATASQCSASATVSSGSQRLSPSPTSSLSPSLSPMAAAALLVGLTGVVDSLILAFLSWKAVPRAEDIPVLVPETRLEQMSLASALVACQ
ncbi:hypothetical protein SEPCBS119000_003922 [Sporothrix epigloea]|uniref:Transcription factor n=1 Tax=Sporothrix epigloea TaxID=1892477 RepID=A0ABP0DRE5_9PEZI